MMFKVDHIEKFKLPTPITEFYLVEVKQTKDALGVVNQPNGLELNITAHDNFSNMPKLMAGDIVTISITKYK